MAVDSDRSPKRQIATTVIAVAFLATALIAAPGATGEAGSAAPGASGGGEHAGPGSAEQLAAARTVDIPDPATWTNRTLAAQLVLAGVQMPSVRSACGLARNGVGGLVLFGTPTSRLRADLAAVQRCAGSIKPWIASDEEGGTVQRLGRLLGRLPSAARMGSTMRPAEIRARARSYGAKMRRLGVNVDLAPVADLRYSGTYIARSGRSFGASPSRVGADVAAWTDGMTDADVAAVVKHWPGHGSAGDSHAAGGRTRSWNSLRARDVLPFRTAFGAGAPAVMVGHMIVPGLTGRLPASQSPAAMTALRADAGDRVVIMTDSLGMAPVTGAMGQTLAQAAIRALAAGSDVALVNTNPRPTIKAIARAIARGRLNRAAVVASARRVINMKADFGLVA